MSSSATTTTMQAAVAVQPQHTDHLDLDRDTKPECQGYTGMNLQRLTALALPFLSLNSTTSTLVPIGTVLSDLMQSPANDNRLLHLVLAVSGAALRVLFPTGQLALSTSVFLLLHLKKMLGHLKNHEWRESFLTGLQIACQLIHASSQYSKNPLLRALSHTLQAVSTFYQVIEYAKIPNQKPEMVASLLLGALQISTATSYLLDSKRPAQPEVVLCVTSPADSNGALKDTEELIFDKAGKHHQIARVTPRNLNELQKSFDQLKKSHYKVTHVMLSCHGCPIAIKPTNFLIRMPTEDRFANDYFLNNSEIARAPEENEYESFDRFATILRKGISQNGKVTLLSCSTAVSVDHTEKNITDALARRLPGIEVSGTTEDFSARDKKVSVTRTTNVVAGPCFTRHVYNILAPVLNLDLSNWAFSFDSTH